MTWTVATPSSAVAKHVALVPGTTVYGNGSSRLFYVYAGAVHRENEGEGQPRRRCDVDNAHD